MNDQDHDMNKDARNVPNGAHSTNAAHSRNTGRSTLFPRSNSPLGLKNALNQFENDIHIKAHRHQLTAMNCGGKKAELNQVDEAGSGLDKENVGANGQSHVPPIDHTFKTRQSEDDSSCTMTDNPESFRPVRNMEGFANHKKASNARNEVGCRMLTTMACHRFLRLAALAVGGSEDETKRNSHRSIAAAVGEIDQAPEPCNGACSGAYFGRPSDDSLAVAVAVVGDEDDDMIPAALKYDPEAKAPARRSCRFHLYFILASVLTIAICASVTVGILQGNNSLTSTQPPAPTTAPTTDREGNGIFYQLIEIVGETNLKNPNSSQGRAADWIIKKDPMVLSPGSDALTQRYLLALFYISTTEDKQWLSCNPPTDQEGDDCTLGTSISAGEVGLPVTTAALGRWLSARHECEWAGIKCDEFNQIRNIDLAGQEIRGTFPPEILLLPFLQSIALPVNELYGTLPSELSSTKHLLNIELQYNFLTGQIPTEWYKIIGLQSINIAGNFITGTISTEIGVLRALKGWFIQENALEGTIPTEFGKVPSIAFTRWSRNFLTGTLPSELGNLRNLKELWVAKNELTGRMPSELGKIHSMLDLRLDQNHITGSVPDEHYNMSELRRWDLYNMNLSGTLSAKISQLTNIQTFRVARNRISGTIPTEMGSMIALQDVELHQNDLTGAIPSALCSLRGLEGIVILSADCGRTNGIDDPMVTCSLTCCSSCCDSATGFCDPAMNSTQTQI
ncbi:hypothetical protein MHU86_18800 [Fragilaria crotonensis]|nr:hypothetical protein MHU86_18800 [Fragilaria crotonensis]